MKIDKVYIYNKHPPFRIETYGIILGMKNDNIIYITDGNDIKSIPLMFFYKHIHRDVKMTPYEKKKCFFVMKNCIKNYKEQPEVYSILSHVDIINNAAKILIQYAPFKRKKYFISKLLNLYKIAECPICFENKRVIKLHNSKTHYVCVNCFIRIDKCPICREKLD